MPGRGAGCAAPLAAAGSAAQRRRAEFGDPSGRSTEGSPAGGPHQIGCGDPFVLWVAHVGLDGYGKGPEVAADLLSRNGRDVMEPGGERAGPAQPPLRGRIGVNMAEGEGFEPPVGLTLRRFSKPVPDLRKVLTVRELHKSRFARGFPRGCEWSQIAQTHSLKAASLAQVRLRVMLLQIVAEDPLLRPLTKVIAWSEMCNRDSRHVPRIPGYRVR